MQKVYRKKTRKVFNMIIILSLSCILFWNQSISVLAAPIKNSSNAENSKRITNEEGLSNVIDAIFKEPQKTITTKPDIPKTSYTSNFTWSSNTTISGIFSSSSLYFSVPKYWQTKYAIVEINYSVSQLIKGVPSTLTFSINNQPFYSCELKYVNNEMQTMYAVIPTELIKEGYNEMQISGYVRLYDQAGCIDDSSSANWINISKDSHVTVGYEIEPHNNMISCYPYPFMSTLDETGKKTSILVSDNRNNGEVAAAMFLASNLGNQTSKENDIQVGLWSDYNTLGTVNNVFIGLTENIPEQLQPYIEGYKDKLEDNGIVLFINDENKNPMIIIASNKKEGLMDAVRMLSEKDRVDQEQSNVAEVKIGSTEIVKNSKTLNDTIVNNYTIESITDGGLSFIGPFHQSKDLILPLSSDYALSSEGKISLKFRYSENLDFDRSLITVNWGNVPIASKKLSKENASSDELTFNIPIDIVGTNAKQISINFDLEIPDLICTPRQMDMPWAYVTKDSSLYLPLNKSIVPQFDTKPMPFQYNGSYNNVLIVLPDEPTTEELTLLGKTITMYGKGADPYGNLDVCTASEFLENIKGKDSSYKDKNIITVGTPDTNKLISTLNGKLYFPFNEEKTMFKSNEKLVLSDNYANRIATMQLLKSPYKEEHSILVLTGATDESLQYIDKTISSDKLQLNLKNDCVLIDSNLDIKTYRFKTEEVKDSKPTFVERIIKNKNSLVFTLASTSVMLILFLSIVLVLIKNRNRNRKHTKEFENKNHAKELENEKQTKEFENKEQTKEVENAKKIKERRNKRSKRFKVFKHYKH